MDLASGRALICSIDVPAIARSCSDWPTLVAFLQRRRPNAHPKTDLKALTMSVIKVRTPVEIFLSSCGQ